MIRILVSQGAGALALGSLGPTGCGTDMDLYLYLCRCGTREPRDHVPARSAPLLSGCLLFARASCLNKFIYLSIDQLRDPPRRISPHVRTLRAIVVRSPVLHMPHAIRSTFLPGQESSRRTHSSYPGERMDTPESHTRRGPAAARISHGRARAPKSQNGKRKSGKSTIVDGDALPE